MKYSIMVAEDEKTATAHLCDIIQFFCPEFEVAACAANGVDALHIAQENPPDIILTDIRMPRMDGLELLTRLHHDLPDICVIMVSGYQDFEYAQLAMRNNASDYILKPVTPAALRSALQKVSLQVDRVRQRKRSILIRRIANGCVPDEREILSVFPSGLYRAVLCRLNGLPRRFVPGTHTDPFDNENRFNAYGRDEMERLHIVSATNPVAGIISMAKDPYLEMGGYTTTVVWDAEFAAADLSKVVKKLYRTLDTCMVTGLNQEIFIGENQIPVPPMPPLRHDQQKQLVRLVHEHNTDRLRQELHRLFVSWEGENRSQLWVANAIRFFLSQYCIESVNTAPEEGLDYMLDDAFYYAMSYNDLLNSLMDIIKKIIIDPDTQSGKIDSPKYFESICMYIRENLSTPLSLQNTSARFALSQSYLSRLFRKYTGDSFNSYLTSLRIEHAKKLLESGETSIRTVAEKVGIPDQYYFSRLFRSMTGRTPSAFLEGDKK